MSDLGPMSAPTPAFLLYTGETAKLWARKIQRRIFSTAVVDACRLPPPLFPSPWSADEHVLTRWPGPVTIRYRSLVCRATGVKRTGWYSVDSSLWKCWQAEDPDLAEKYGLPRRSPEVGNMQRTIEVWERRLSGAMGRPSPIFDPALGLTSRNPRATLRRRAKETP